MIRFRHALVIGKFYPPHAGHHFLIEAAAQWSSLVTVVVMAADSESLALDRRVAWLREMFRLLPRVRVVGAVDNDPTDFESEASWQRQTERIRGSLARADEISGGGAPVSVDAVFSSEGYGDELARRFGAVPVCLDPGRQSYPVSGAAVRRDPPGHWHLLSPGVRQALCQRVVIVGAESTGKTTLARELAAALRRRGGIWSRTLWLAEYGREYTVGKLAVAQGRARFDLTPLPAPETLRWESSEFEHIAEVQQEREERAAADSGPVLVCDTDVFATEVWHERYLGTRSAALRERVRLLPPRLCYLLTEWRDVPFENDGLRDGEQVRGWMHGTFVERLREAGALYHVVDGAAGSRLAQALAWLDARLASAWRFAGSCDG